MTELYPAWISMVQGLPFVRSLQVVEGRLVLKVENPAENNPVIVRRLVQLEPDLQFVGELMIRMMIPILIAAYSIVMKKKSQP